MKTRDIDFATYLVSNHIYPKWKLSEGGHTYWVFDQDFTRLQNDWMATRKGLQDMAYLPEKGAYEV